jgi:hypothetical protein
MKTDRMNRGRQGYAHIARWAKPRKGGSTLAFVIGGMRRRVRLDQQYP